MVARYHDCIRPSHLASTLHGTRICFSFIYPKANQSHRKANAIGRSSKTVREFLERNYKEEMDREQTIRLAIKSLLEVVQTGAKNIEIAIMAPGKTVEMLPVADIENYVKYIEQEKQEEAAKKKGSRTGAAGSSSIPSRGADADQ